MYKLFILQKLVKIKLRGNKMKKIGKCLSDCIADIISGKVREEDILFILSETAAVTDVEWRWAIDQNRHGAWKDNPEEGEAICRRLIRAEKIIQPRLEGLKCLSLKNGIWLNVVEGN
jgi:hypothetical protein